MSHELGVYPSSTLGGAVPLNASNDNGSVARGAILALKSRPVLARHTPRSGRGGGWHGSGLGRGSIIECNQQILTLHIWSFMVSPPMVQRKKISTTVYITEEQN